MEMYNNSIPIDTSLLVLYGPEKMVNIGVRVEGW
jgi:hypothetical protein